MSAGQPSAAPRVALVTGSGRNLGRAIAIELARGGADLVVNVRTDLRAAEAVAEEIRGLGRRAVVHAADVADENAVHRLFAAVEVELGGIDILVNNAGPRAESPFQRLTRADWDAVIGAVLTGAFHCSQAAVPRMRERGWGRIVNVLGAIAHTGQPHRAHLAAAKAGLLGLTRALAVELGPAGITVNAVSPGPLDTVPPPGLDPELRLRRAIHKPIPRLGTAAEVAAMIAFLASDQAGFVTGQAIAVNGGEVMLG